MGLEWENNSRVIDAVKEIAEVVAVDDGRTISASQFLEYFMFPPETQYRLISKLSGGELRRLNLLTVLIRNPNFLVLDEPTNDPTCLPQQAGGVSARLQGMPGHRFARQVFP
ncbi:MAG: ATP-binding cassette domain-containing protein [Bacteroidales bacterium]